MAYTEQQIAELKSVGTMNFEIAQIFADKHGLGVRSVIAKAKALEIPYTAKTPGEKKKKSSGVKRTKAMVVADLIEVTGLELASLDKMTLVDLEALLFLMVELSK